MHDLPYTFFASAHRSVKIDERQIEPATYQQALFDYPRMLHFKHQRENDKDHSYQHQHSNKLYIILIILIHSTHTPSSSRPCTTGSTSL
jgi:hypothetical protein